MINAKRLADDMVESINVNSNFLKSFAGGALELPVDLFYLGRSFLDTDNRSPNSFDGERCIRLVKNGYANRKNLQKIANIIIDRYLDKVDVNKLKSAGTNFAGSISGSVIMNRMILGNIGTMFADRMVAKMLIGFSFSSMLSLGALQARAIYTSRELSKRDPELHNHLRRLGDLDLLYFLMEKRVQPFEAAFSLWRQNRPLFDEVSRYFLQKVRR
ncbi:hypothetical protein LU604_14690 [Erwinia tracheiphila]|uniref:Uncharacterized protein n=1 Tax=Erwinia tracheiphila TaxID=65700 RepID=A0A345CQ21_9GAMM|nr:hypothetical protein [Erwinia tracheiphila]AXF75538.1 hypothetical protein AV903_04530 [Erwinia tracheiphila]UIA81914.1 hypothetical protein LU604_14690 [Erwinia tracheiphila]UIA90509.1 hypothetical protein LU632_14260 [Erwinia tracheiphila]